MAAEHDSSVGSTPADNPSPETLSPVEAMEPSASDQAWMPPNRGDDLNLDDIPIIGAHMLHRERVDLEASMNVFPPITIGLIVACTLIYGRQLMIGSLDNLERVIDTGAMNRSSVLDGEVWRLISAGFLHANGEHLFGNMGMLYILGMACEHAFGRRPFLFLYLAACTTGSLLAMTSDTPMVGASGAIFGLAGALIAMIYTRRHAIELRDHRVGIVLAIWSVFSIVLGLLNPIISNSCHLGGLLGGLLLGAILPPAILHDRKEFARRPLTRMEGFLSAAVLISTAFCFLPRLR